MGSLALLKLHFSGEEVTGEEGKEGKAGEGEREIGYDLAWQTLIYFLISQHSLISFF